MTVPLRAIKSGKIRLQVFRNVDLARARESKAVADQRRQDAEKKARERGLPNIGTPRDLSHWDHGHGHSHSHGHVDDDDVINSVPVFYQNEVPYQSLSVLHDVFGATRAFMMLGPFVCVFAAVLALRLCVGKVKLVYLTRGKTPKGKQHRRGKQRGGVSTAGSPP